MLSNEAEFCFECDDTYHVDDEGSFMWDNPDLVIAWPTLDGDDAFDPSKVVLSDKDKLRQELRDLRAVR